MSECNGEYEDPFYLENYSKHKLSQKIYKLKQGMKYSPKDIFEMAQIALTIFEAMEVGIHNKDKIPQHLMKYFEEVDLCQ